MLIVCKDADFSNCGIGKIEIPRELSGLTDVLFTASGYGDISNKKKYAIDDFVVALKIGGYWDKIHNLYVPILANSENSMLIDVKTSVDKNYIVKTEYSDEEIIYDTSCGIRRVAGTSLKLVSTLSGFNNGFSIFGYSSSGGNAMLYDTTHEVSVRADKTTYYNVYAGSISVSNALSEGTAPFIASLSNSHQYARYGDRTKEGTEEYSLTTSPNGILLRVKTRMQTLKYLVLQIQWPKKMPIMYLTC